MKTAMQELKDVIGDMIKNGGTEEDLFAVISHIDNWAFEKEKEQIINAVENGREVFGDSYDWDYEFSDGEEYYNQTYNQNK